MKPLICITLAMLFVGCENSNPVSTEPKGDAITSRFLKDTLYYYPNEQFGAGYVYMKWLLVENVSNNSVNNVGYYVLDTTGIYDLYPAPGHWVSRSVDTIYTRYLGTMLPHQKDTVVVGSSGMAAISIGCPWIILFWDK